MNNKKRKIKVTSVVIATGALIVASVLVSLSSLTARAATDATELLKKSLALGISKCVNKTYMQAGPIKESDFRNTGVSLIMTSKGRQDKVVYVPTQFGNTLTTAKVTCQELFQGANRGSKKGRADGLMQLYNKSNPGLTDLSYEVGESGSGGDKKGCIAIRYFTSDKSKKTTNKICFKLDSDNRVVFKSNSDFEVNKITTPIGLSFYLSTQEIGVENAENTRVSFSALTQVKDGDNWDTVVQNMDKALKSKDNPVYNAYNNDGQRLGLSYDSTDSSTTNNSSTFSDYVFTNNPAVVLKAFTGKGLFSDVKFTAQEKYDLLEAYYNRYASGSEKVLSTGDCFSTKEQAKQKSNSGYAHYENGKWCAVLNSEQVPSDLKFNVVNGSNNGLTPKDFNGILKELTDWNFNALDGSTGDNAGVNGSTDNGEDGDEDIQSPCTLAGGPLSWILCPVLTIVGDVIEGLYNWIENEFLVVDSGLYSTGGETYNAWKEFQKYANIFFIILLVLVIISQVTGFGISNYGIKRTLPKLIIAIVLINVSFFVCQLAVDLSNVVGSTVKDVFGGITMAVQGGGEGSGGLSGVVGTILTYVTGVGEISAAAVGIGALALNVVQWDTWMFPLILTLIACVLGVIFFFIILCVRQAAVIILIILAPLAVAAYALPNTKKLFDRWFKLFTAMLMVYPICGLLVGGGNFVSSLLVNQARDGDAGFGLVLVGLLANIVPFFLIPGILRSSMAAMGNLGAKISGFGSRLTGGISRGFRNSELAKDMQRKSTMRNADYLNARMKRKYGENPDLANMSDRQRRAYDRAHRRFARREAANLRTLEDEAAIRANDGRHMSLDDEEFNRLVSGKQLAQLEQDVKNQQAAYELMTDFDTGDAKKVGAEYQKVLNDFLDDPSDRANGIKMRALQNILAKDDPGRAQLRNAFYGARANGREAGLDIAAQHLLANHGKVIKDEDRGFHTALTHFSSKNFEQAPDSFVRRADVDGNGQEIPSTVRYSSNYDTMKSDSWSDDTWSRAGSAAYKGTEDAIQYGTIKEPDRANLVGRSINVLGNERLSGTKGGDAGAQSRIIARGATETELAGMNSRAMGSMVKELNKAENAALRQEFVNKARSALANSNNHFDANALNELRQLQGISAADIERATTRGGRRFEGGGRIDHGTGGGAPNQNSGANPTPRPAPETFGGRVTDSQGQGFSVNAPSGTLTDSGIYVPNSLQPPRNDNNSGQ